MNEEKQKIIIEEQYFPYENMTRYERDMCLDYLYKVKDIYDSELTKIKNFKIVSCIFNKIENNIYSFSLFSSNGIENRSITGDISIKKNKIVIKCKVDRLCVGDNNKSYHTIDMFEKVKDDVYHQTSIYSFGGKYERDIKLPSYNSNEFISSSVFKGFER